MLLLDHLLVFLVAGISRELWNLLLLNGSILLRAQESRPLLRGFIFQLRVWRVRVLSEIRVLLEILVQVVFKPFDLNFDLREAVALVLVTIGRLAVRLLIAYFLEGGLFGRIGYI